MERLWDCDRIDILISKLLRSNIEEKLTGIDKVKFAANYGVTKLKKLN